MWVIHIRSTARKSGSAEVRIIAQMGRTTQDLGFALDTTTDLRQSYEKDVGVVARIALASRRFKIMVNTDGIWRGDVVASICYASK